MKRTVINLRGTNGAGKTTVAEWLAGRRANESVGGVDVELLRYEKENKTSVVSKPVWGRWCASERVMLVGRYGHANCGGCDTIPTQDLVCDAVRAAVAWPNAGLVVFEGSLVSTIFQRYVDLALWCRGQGWSYIWGYLQTPADTCVSRVRERSGDAAKVTTILDKARAVAATRLKAMQAAEPVMDLSPGWIDRQGGLGGPEAWAEICGRVYE